MSATTGRRLRIAVPTCQPITRHRFPLSGKVEERVCQLVASWFAVRSDAFAWACSFISSVATRARRTFSQSRENGLVRMPHVTMDSFSSSAGWWKDQDYLYAASLICRKTRSFVELQDIVRKGT